MQKKAVANDIRYRGPLSYRGLRFFALLAMTGSQLAALFLGLIKLSKFVDPYMAEEMMEDGLYTLFNILKYCGAITFPLLLTASMSIVIRDRNKIFKVMLSNFLLAAVTYFFVANFAEGVIKIFVASIPRVAPSIPHLDETLTALLTNLIDNYTGGDVAGALAARGIPPETVTAVLAYVGGAAEDEIQNMSGVLQNITSSDLAKRIIDTFPVMLEEMGITSDEVMDAVATAFTDQLVRSHLNVNVFLDLFVCTVFFFFMEYRPKRLTGGKLMLFRCGAILPAAWLLVGVMLTGMNRAQWVEMNLPVKVVALLPSRKLPGLMLFICMMMYVKYHETEILSRGGTVEDVDAFMSSNRSSFRFSLFICVVLAALSLADWGMSFVAGGKLIDWGIGGTPTLFLAIPFVLLFSYQRKPRFKALDLFVPVYYFLNYFILFVVAMMLLFAIPQLLDGVPLSGINWELI